MFAMRLDFVQLVCCFLQLRFWLLGLRSCLSSLLLPRGRSRLQHILLLDGKGSAVVAILVIIVDVDRMDMWNLSVTRRKRINGLLVALHIILVVLVLQVLRGVLLMQLPRGWSCSVALLSLHHREPLVQ
jgi:hypothetical protein